MTDSLSQRPPVSAARAAAIIAALLVLGGCSSFASKDKLLGLVTPYKVEVVQGNVITKEQVAMIKPGLTRSQVRDILGSPLLTDVFHTDRWDYIFTIRRQGAAPQRRQVTVHFEGDALKSIEAPELPAEREFVASIDTKKAAKAPPLVLSEEQLKRLPAPKPAAAAPGATAQPTTEPNRSYPPLEPQ
ncbi:outer membrane protein assembly factor BamE [Piscinibacter sakaiensis]|uniref:outer membrane protein assembly factor BamE n=1 Tax=Piscinibacter sakaiensis TaxID=1547922 RepID=UPI003AAAA8CC